MSAASQLPQFTVQPGDKVFAGCCSRCGGPVNQFLLIAEWNGQEFGYCQKCAGNPIQGKSMDAHREGGKA